MAKLSVWQKECMGGGTKIPREQALAVAKILVAELEPHCERIEICGSIRRQKPAVSDIEILFVPRWLAVRDLFGEPTGSINLAGLQCSRWLSDKTLERRPNKNGVFTWGPQNKLAIHTASGIPVDLFETTAANWWMAVVIRTGPKELNVTLCTAAAKRGLNLHAYGTFTRLSDGEVLTVRSEREVFEIAGLPYLEPTKR